MVLRVPELANCPPIGPEQQLQVEKDKFVKNKKYRKFFLIKILVHILN